MAPFRFELKLRSSAVYFHSSVRHIIERYSWLHTPLNFISSFYSFIRSNPTKKLIFLTGIILVIGCTALSQTRTVNGKITDENGSPVLGASVVVKGSSIGTTSDTAGLYIIMIPPKGKVLVFSSINKQSKEITIGEQTIINVTLTRREQIMDEVVVVAYGTQKKTNVTGSLNTVNYDVVENKPFTSIDKALQGLVSGLQSVAASGAPGANQQIRLRGIGSIGANANPLWVIDGVPVNSGDVSRLTTTSNLLSTLNPNDIEHITVLKDAAASSIYGSRAANGVILITTKKGKAGKTKFRFDSEMGVSDIAFLDKKYLPLNANEYFTLTREGLINAGLATNSNVESIMTANWGYGNGVNTNWLNENTRKGKQAQYNISAGGGNDKTTFFISGGYFREEGLTLQTDFKRYTTNIGLTNKATKRLNLGLNVNAGFVRQNTPLAGSFFANPVWGSFQLLPSIAPYKPDGSFNITAPDFGPGNLLYNTVALAELDKRLLKQLSLRSNVNVDYTISDNLKFTSNFGIDYNVLEEDQYNNPFHGGGAATQGRAYGFLTRYFNWVFTNKLDYTNKIDKRGKVNFDVKLGYEAQKSQGYFISAQSQAFPPNVDLNYAIVGATPVAAGSSFSDYSFLSAFSIANIYYQNRLIVSGSYRRDGSSRFGINNQYGDFWSIGWAWNIDKENFMKSLDVIDQLKFRGSYGVNGNAGIGNYAWRPLYGYGFNYNQQPGSAPSNVGNIDLTWELNKPTNIGLDLGMIKNKIVISVDYYTRTTKQLLLAAPLSRTTGFVSITKNLGSVRNKGVELQINAKLLQSKDFEWTATANFARNNNRIMSLVNGQDIVDDIFIRRVGENFQSYYARQWAGVDPANGDPLWYVDSSKTTTTNNWNIAQRVLAGSASPKYFGSVINAVTYKGFSLSIMFYYNFGNYIRDTWAAFYMSSGMNGGFNKIQRQFDDRWKQPGDNANLPGYVFDGNKLAHNFSTLYLFKGDYIRLRDVMFGYQVGQSLIQELGLTGAMFYVRGTNLWTWVKDKNFGFDPEQGVSSQANMEVFIPKTVAIGFKIRF